MRRARYSAIAGAALLLVCAGAPAQDKATKEAAEKIYAQAQQEPDSGKAAEMYCNAARMLPKNTEYQNQCNGARRAMLDVDQRNMQRAIDAADSGKIESAKSYAKKVTTLDAKLHDQAQQLLAKLNGSEKPAVPIPGPAQPNPSVALLEQAQKAFDSGNLQGAKSLAGQVSDASVKPQANMLISMIDRYNNLVSSGRSHEESKDYNGAIGAYESALAISPHASGENLNDRIQHLRTQQVAVNNPPPNPTPNPPPTNLPPTNARPSSPPPTAKPVEVSLEDRKKKLEDAYAVAANRKDLDGEERTMRQLLQLDPNNASAKSRLEDAQKQLAAALNRDPAKLEKTLHDAIAAFYDSRFEDAESALNRYLGADAGKKKGAAYFYLGATQQAEALLESSSKHTSRQAQARNNFKQARSAGYQPVQKYVSEKILQAWQQAGM